ncbi:hypothetical protein GE061_007325 [Apolygus lucorum]|uniref:Uncharacterized protein n=1 Tax=Apolygus lucorum TaxID=248454 RepID=A0A6A4J957_APOLU|nr:hypothetical protein GE061_007325 [Apolygus lucorum]
MKLEGLIQDQRSQFVLIQFEERLSEVFGPTMVSPRHKDRKEGVDIENHARFGVSWNLSGVKSNLLQKSSNLPLGDVMNKLDSAPARNILKGLSDEVTKNVMKDSELKTSKPIPIPVNIVQEKLEEEEELDPVWNAPLAYNELEDDTYWDILPLSLRLTDEDIRRFVLNQPTLSSKIIDDADFVPSPDYQFADVYCEAPDFEAMLNSDEDLPEVPPLSDEDSLSDEDDVLILRSMWIS